MKPSGIRLIGIGCSGSREHHGLVPLLYRRLSVAMDPTQSAGLEAFRQRDKVNAHRTLWLTVELINIHKHLVARGLEVLPYKGPALAESLYGNVALRQFSDLDLAGSRS